MAALLGVCFVVRGVCLLRIYGAMNTHSYQFSSALGATAYDDTTKAWKLFFYYGSEAAVREGASPAGRELRQRAAELEAACEKDVSALEKQIEEAEKTLSGKERDTQVSALKGQIEVVREDCAAEIASRENAAVEEVFHLKEYFLPAAGMFAAYVDSEGNCTSTAEFLTDEETAKTFFETLPAAVYVGAGYYSARPENAVRVVIPANMTIPDSGTLYVGYSKELYESLESNYQQAYEMSKRGPGFLLWGGAAVVGAMCWLCYAAGCSSKRRGVKLLWIDRVYTDVYFLLTVAGIGLCIWLVSRLTAAVSSGSYGNYLIEQFARDSLDELTLLFVYAPVLLATLAGIAFVLSCARRIKMGVMIRQSLAGAAYHALAKIFRVVTIGKGDLPENAARPVTALALLEAAFVPAGAVAFLWLGRIGLFFVLMAFLLYNLWVIGRLKDFIRDYYRLSEDVRRIGSGELSHRVDESAVSDMKTLASGINDIAKGMEANLEERLRSERMRTELITNVSHDLRTPLTSLITYVDLLKKSGFDDARAPEYLDVLDKKSHRLKQLTDDLFEAAKVASGTLPVQIERIDLQALIGQGLAELEDRIEQSGLTVCTDFPPQKVFALADGRRLWRALENLLSNALKYSLPGTRVYLDVSEEEGKAKITLKNISRERFSRSREQLMERFVRGDSARHTEGSGLGLSISRSLCELMHGTLELEVDGDLFKAVILLPAALPEERIFWQDGLGAGQEGAALGIAEKEEQSALPGEPGGTNRDFKAETP